MKDFSQLRSRYLRDPVSVQLGGLAANLARVRSFSDNPSHCEVVAQLLEESACFMEWAAPDAGFETQVFLAECQRQLTHWRFLWDEIWPDASRRAEIADQAGQWSERILELSGLSGKIQS